MSQKTSFIFILCAVVFFSCGRPAAKFTYKAESKEAPVQVEFDNQSKNADSYTWDFGDGNTSSEKAPRHTYYTSGNYVVRLKAIKGDKEVVTEKQLIVEAPEQCLVKIETDYGDMTVLLYDATPKHRDNFLKLAEEGFYDGLLFHRVIEGFMIQGGDPESRDAPAGKPLGMGGPGYQLPAEFVDTLFHYKGALSAARQGDQVNPGKKSSGSQFYIVQGSNIKEHMLDRVQAQKGMRYTDEQRKNYLKLGGTPHLDGEYTVFGIVVEGLEVIDKIAAVKTGQGNRPVKDVRMKVRVLR